MEQQFILRLPESLQSADLSTVKLSKLNEKEVQLVHGNKTYKGMICRLPTILETQQCIENKLFKVADVSTLIVIFPEEVKPTPEELGLEINKHERSGVTPPMFHIRDRRAKTTKLYTEIYEQIEQRVQELLKEDSKAIHVEVTKEEVVDKDIELFAAAIEKELPVRKEEPVVAVKKEEEIKPISIAAETKQREEGAVDEELRGELTAIEEKIRERKALLDKTVNPILKKRFAQMLEQLEEERRMLLERKK